MIVDELKRFWWGVSIEIAEFPELLARFREKESLTGLIERQGAILVQHEFRSTDLQEFITSVCKWGGYPGIAARVINDNSPQFLSASFRSAYADTLSGDDVAALERLLQLRGFAVSFASKHLKFLAPDRAVVLDSTISARLGYPMSSDGYRTFLADCHTILGEIVDGALPYTGWGANGWRVSDVEMAIFEKLRT